MNYEIGQVLYVVLKKEATIYPVQVVEIVTKKTISGEEVAYMVKAGVDKVIPLNEIHGDVFTSSVTVKQALTEKASQSITQRTDNAIAKGKEWYANGFERSADALDSLGNAKKSVASKKQVSVDVAALAAELQAEADEGNIIEMPDGSKARVRNVKIPDSLS